MKKLLLIILIVFTTIMSTLFVSISAGLAQSEFDWTEPINLSNSGASTNPSIVIDSDGVIHVIWVDQFDGYKYVESVDGVTWTLPITVEFPFSPENDPPRFDATNDGVIHIFWKDDKDVLYYTQTLQANFELPALWNPPVRLGDSVVDYDITVSAMGDLHVSYIKNDSLDNEPAGVYYRGSLDNGLSWSSEQMLFESPYFRSLAAGMAHIRIAVSNNAESENVYIVWDSRKQKRIYLAKSADSGQTWDEAEQIKGPEEITGYLTPFNVEIYALEKTFLLLWQVGEANNQCTQYSQLILNDGNNWDEPAKMLDGNVGCPEESEFFSVDQNLSLLLLKIQGGISLMAWNGNEWSDLQLQNELLNIFNPATFDSILLGCQQFSVHNGVLYVVGCDQGSDGDIWFSSRSLGSLENWYPSLSNWSSINSITNTEQMISSISSVAYLDSVHLFWVQVAQDGSPSIQYSRWNGEKWLDPRAVISNLTGRPLQIFVTKDQEGRLLLVWVDGKDGDLYFSWADVNGAGLSSEWIQPEIVPSISQLSRSPDMLVDGSGRIIIAYSISMNEGRGIYIVQSTDHGASWSSPLQVYDAVSAGWEIVDNPKISLSGDGRLHLLLNRYSTREDDQSMGLYYMQSTDGGITWSEAELVKEDLIVWSDIRSHDKQTVHRMWQEDNGLEVSYIDQLSFDGGVTWEVPVKILSANEDATQVSLTEDQMGGLYLAQLSYGEETILQDWKWDGSHWILQEAKEMKLVGDGTRYSITHSITSDGNLVVSIAFENIDLAGKKTNEIGGVHRLLDITETTLTPFLAIMPTPKSIITPSDIPDITPTSIVNAPPSLPLGTNNAPSIDRRNLVGMFLVIAILILTVVIIRPKGKNR